MDTTRWKFGDDFPLLDLIAQFAFKTPTSVSFDLGTRGNSLQLPGMDEPWVMDEPRVFTVIGWLDAHHPCEGFHRLQLRVGLPERYACMESINELVPQVKAALQLPDDEPYRITLAGLAEQFSKEEPLAGFA